ncbi:hypothetical protein [Kosakonia phage Kc166A]|uniref:Uncharacterized protein n=1 Tax=Kosakonia phage Kc166A TaxID=2801381 RepID=A0AAE7RII3_9CAUD|nr:hypothetical protein [Kosakonia phage Kc166A]
MKDLLIYIIIAGLWVTSVATDGNSERFGWMAVDILLWPVGMVRGLLILFGIVG